MTHQELCSKNLRKDTFVFFQNTLKSAYLLTLEVLYYKILKPSRLITTHMVLINGSLNRTSPNFSFSDMELFPK